MLPLSLEPDAENETARGAFPSALVFVITATGAGLADGGDPDIAMDLFAPDIDEMSTASNWLRPSLSPHATL
jgi:hypothetical protein